MRTETSRGCGNCRRRSGTPAGIPAALGPWALRSSDRSSLARFGHPRASARSLTDRRHAVYFTSTFRVCSMRSSSLARCQCSRGASHGGRLAPDRDGVQGPLESQRILRPGAPLLY